MEAVGCVRIFSRSILPPRNLQYIKYLGDGDSASFKKVLESNPYGGIDIEKLECVGHVQKRCGTRLRRLKAQNKGLKLEDGKGLSGLGRLTDKKIDTLQNYYGMAIRQNAGNLQAMVLAVKSVLDHVASSDTDPKHQHCDPHWCGYLKDPSSYKHKNSLPRSVVEFIRPIFNDLADEKLLSRCLHGKTQNANESLNKLIWDRCSKEYFVEKTTIEESVYSAISHFNDGASSILKLHEKLGIARGDYSEKLCKKKDEMHEKIERRQSTEKARKRRKTLRAIKKGFVDKAKESEGDLYTSGGH
ncbi:Short-chain collagen C4 [Biomphalaria glabrata]|nr:Short-chain collagen C4 [Biomphalaria glabrata]